MERFLCNTHLPLDERNENVQPIPELLSIQGVPTYFVLDFSSRTHAILRHETFVGLDRIVWRGRLCVRNQLEYKAAVDHMLADVNELGCQIEGCELCHYASMGDRQVDAELESKTNEGEHSLSSGLLGTATRLQSTLH